MGKKFMIVKPTPCCGNTSNIGKVFICVGEVRFDKSRCSYCGHFNKDVSMLVPKHESGNLTYTEESRIIWLPEESDVIKHDEKQEITA